MAGVEPVRALDAALPILGPTARQALDRLAGAAQALTFLRQFDFEPPQSSFDAAFSSDAP